MTMMNRGIRGATTIPRDEAELVLQATEALLKAILAANPELAPEEIASVFFTVTPDISSAFPARAARGLGWRNVPLMCMQEIPVAGSLTLCIRILIHWNTDTPQDDIQHIYLNGAQALRPDLVKENSYSHKSEGEKSP
jgi:chorismate mutase